MPPTYEDLDRKQAASQWPDQILVAHLIGVSKTLIKINYTPYIERSPSPSVVVWVYCECVPVVLEMVCSIECSTRDWGDSKCTEASFEA